MKTTDTKYKKNANKKAFFSPIVARSSAINPYRFAISAVRHRLKWDVNPESWRSRRKLKSWQDKYLGKKAVILCNGPSLLQSDLSLLEGFFTFGLNKINLLFDKSSFRPSCIVAVDSLVIEQNADFYNQTNIPLFINSNTIKLIRASNKVAFLHLYGSGEFARDCSVSVGHGSTVTFVAMQLAFHMGFKDVALIGCDHNFTTNEPSYKVVVSGEKDENHFDPNYFAGGVKWQIPDLVASKRAFCVARDIFSAYDRRLVNCTEGGKLEVLERKSLKLWLKEII